MKGRETVVASVVTVVLLLSLGCGWPRGPILGGATKQPGVGGTIAGIVKSDGGTIALSGRKVTAINIATGARFEASTASNGGYTIQVPKGDYRIEVELRPGEALAAQPSPTDINVGDLDARRDFVVTVALP